MGGKPGLCSPQTACSRSCNLGAKLHRKRVQLFRITQEAVSNAVKHSKAAKISIQLRRRENQVEMRIKDNGTGIPDHSVPGRGTGMGLLTMSHRARMLGGSLSVEPGKKGGTVVTCIIPLTCP